MAKYRFRQENYKNVSCRIAFIVMATALVCVSPANAQPTIASVDQAAKCAVDVVKGLPNTLSAAIVGTLIADNPEHETQKEVRYAFGPHNVSTGPVIVMFSFIYPSSPGHYGMSLWPQWPILKSMSFLTLKRDSSENPLHDGFDLLEKKCNITYSTPDIVADH